jgi:prevent-host-death family protein
MTTIGFDQARTGLSELLDQVAGGKSILITRRGKPAAILQPPPDDFADDVEATAEEMLAYRDSRIRTFGRIKAREVIEDGRRF